MSSVIPDGRDPTGDSVTVPVVAPAPPSVSLASTFATAVPPAAEVTPPESSAATIAFALPVTVTVTVAVSQFAGVAVSQIR